MGCCSSADVKTGQKGDQMEDYEDFELQYDHPQHPRHKARSRTGSAIPQPGHEAGEGTPPANNHAPEAGLWPMATPRGSIIGTPREGGGGASSRSPSLYSPLDQSLYCPSSIASNASFVLTGSKYVRSNVTADAVERYVARVNNEGDTMSLFADSFSGSVNAGAGDSAGNSGGGSSQAPNSSFLQQLHTCNSIPELELLEALRRSEVYANFAVTSKMIRLAARRVVPVMRRKTGRSSSRAKKAVLVVHHQDLHHKTELDGQTDTQLSATIHADPTASLNTSFNPAHRVSTCRTTLLLEEPEFSPIRCDDEGDVSRDGKQTPPGSQGNSPASRRGSSVLKPSLSSGSLLTRRNTNCDGAIVAAAAGATGATALGTQGVFIHRGVCAKPVFSMEGYNAMGIECDPKKFKPKATSYGGTGWDLFSEPDATELLNQGHVLFKFRCTTVKNMTDEDRDLVQPLVNTSGYQDEQAENNVPIIDFNNHKDIGLWTLIVVKTCYMLPGLKFEDVTPSLLGSYDYHHNCEPGPPKVHPDDPKYPDTSRSSYTFIKFVFGVTLMLKAHELGPEYCEKLEYIDGIVPAKILIQERTKRDLSKSDGTVTVKSILMYYPVTGGVLVSNLTFILNRSVPRVAAPLVNSFGSQGAKDGATTAERTRAFLLKKFGDSRKELK